MMDVALVNDGPVTIVLDSRLREDGTLKGTASSPGDLCGNAAASGES
ncbi:unnamed protein product [Dibothriocephalus latus]|uniref:Uncharacterized protein n=1 Tax=Dibothriocephalus latus TaxID=60516 RepID=A0A3P7LGY8_DIBLA|nr:unnamed protein product [Dibothriocephalus latus]